MDESSLKTERIQKMEGKYSGNQFLAQGDFTNLALYEKLSIGAMIFSVIDDKLAITVI